MIQDLSGQMPNTMTMMVNRIFMATQEQGLKQYSVRFTKVRIVAGYGGMGSLRRSRPIPWQAESRTLIAVICPRSEHAEGVPQGTCGTPVPILFIKRGFL